MAADAKLRLGMAFARSWMAFAAGAAPRPISAAFAVTWRCNLRCSYCNTPFLDEAELPPQRIAPILDSLRALGVQRVGYAGGEPLLRDDIGELVAMARERGFFVTLNSNLQLYPRRKDAFRDVDLVFTSLDGRAEAHRQNRGPRSFDGVLDAIDALVDDGKRVVAIAVVTGHNVGELDHLIDLADRHGFRVHLQHHGTGAECARGSRSSLDQAREREFWNHALRAKRGGRAIATSGQALAALARWHDYDITAEHRPGGRCAGGTGFLYVTPSGKAYACAYVTDKTRAVDLTTEDWRSARPQPPCNTCIAGPYLSFNELYRKPLAGGLAVLRDYLRGSDA